jgi:hypothetical protein
MTRSKPNLFIIGYAKCGTTSLYAYLNRHPDFCGSLNKEPGYFHKKKFDESLYDVDEYLKFFDNCSSERFIFEASTAYIYGGLNLAKFIDREFPNTRIVVILREPTSRLFSYYKLCIDYNYIDQEMDFEGFLEEGDRRVAAGERPTTAPWRGYYMRYTHQLFEWMDHFGDRLFVGFFDDLKTDPAGFCDAICAWLDVAPLSDFADRFEVENRTITPRSTTLHRAARAVNATLEPVLRRNPGLKRGVRRLYHAFNESGAPAPGMTDEQRRRLHAMFAPSNAALAAELRRRRPALALPPWLAEAGAER